MLRLAMDLRQPAQWYPQARATARTIHAHLGPTNSGKTHAALERQALKSALDHASSYDPLTGVCNRYMVQDRLKLGMRHALRTNQPLALMFVDLDNKYGTSEATAPIWAPPLFGHPSHSP